MVRLLLGAYIKRFLSIFLSLIFIGCLSAGIFNSFLSAKGHLKDDPARFFEEYGYVDEYISIPLDERSEYKGLYDIEGVESIDMRLSLDVHLEKDDGRIINARIHTYTGEESEILKHYVVSSIPRDEQKYNVAVASKFAANNAFKLGQELTLSLYGYEQTVYVNEIVDTVEGIFPTFNPYVWDDDCDFGYLYFRESDLNQIMKGLALVVALYPEIKKSLLEFTNLDTFSVANLTKDYASKIVNEIIIKNKPGYSEDEILDKVNEYLDEHGIKPNFAIKGDDWHPRKYMRSVDDQLGVAFLFLPIFFYAIIMVLVGLFTGQIIRQTTRDIGIMLANGTSRAQIIRVLLTFTLLISFIASLLSIPIGYGLSTLIASAMVKTYCISIITNSLSVPVILLSAASLIASSTLACFIACVRIFSITPKDAAMNNETLRKPLPKKVAKVVSKMPFIPQNATNSMLQNKRRTLISTFTICASLLMILLCGTFYLSKTALINQGCDRRMNFDCQVYLQEEATPALVASLEEEEGIARVLDCYYSYIEIENPKGETKYLECLAFDPSLNEGLIDIPSEDGFGSMTLPEEGIVIPKGYANDLGVKKGDVVIINGKEVEVVGISFQYYHPMTYLSKAQYESTGADYYSSLLLKMTDPSQENALSKTLSEKTNRSLIVFTSRLKIDLHHNFDTLDIFLWIMTIFALAITLMVLFIMSKNALAEQIREFALFRAVGFRIGTISKIFLFQNGVELLLALIFAIPLNIASSNILFSLASSPRQTYPFIFSVPLIGIALAFVVAVIGIIHLLSLRKIKKIDLAENLRSNE